MNLIANLDHRVGQEVHRLTVRFELEETANPAPCTIGGNGCEGEGFRREINFQRVEENNVEVPLNTPWLVPVKRRIKSILFGPRRRVLAICGNRPCFEALDERMEADPEVDIHLANEN